MDAPAPAPAPGLAASALAAPGLLQPDLAVQLLPFLAEAICLYDGEGRLKARLSAPGGILGLGDDVGSNLFQNLHPDDLPRALQVAEAVMTSEPGWTGQMRVRLHHADGSYRPYQVRAFNRLGEPGIDGIVLSVREVIIDVDHLPERVAAEPLVQSMADALPTPYVMVGNKGNVRFTSPAAEELLGCTAEDLYGRHLIDLFRTEDRAVVATAVDAVTSKPGQRTSVATTLDRFGDRLLEVNLHSSGSVAHTAMVAVMFVDRTEEPELVRQATHDPLTGLANRTKIVNTATGLLLDTAPDLSVSAVYLDVDRFKRFNDAHGHAVGDCALLAVADRLRSLTEPTDLVGRMGGDEFVLVCPGISPERLAVLLTDLLRPLAIDGPDGDLAVTVTAGSATVGRGGSAAELLRRADEDMLAAKRSTAR